MPVFRPTKLQAMLSELESNSRTVGLWGAWNLMPSPLESKVQDRQKSPHESGRTRRLENRRLRLAR